MSRNPRPIPIDMNTTPEEIQARANLMHTPPDTIHHPVSNRAARRRNAQNKLPKNLTDQNLDTVIVMRAAAEGAVVLLQGMADLLDAMPTENDEDRTVIEEFKKAANTTTAILSMSLIQ